MARAARSCLTVGVVRDTTVITSCRLALIADKAQTHMPRKPSGSGTGLRWYRSERQKQ